MASFQFVAKDSTGQELRGTIDADDRESAIAGIRAHGLMPTAIGEVKSGASASKKPASAQKPASAPMPGAAPMPGHDSAAPNQMDAKLKKRKLVVTPILIFLLCPLIGIIPFMKWIMPKIKRILLNKERGFLQKSCKIYACGVFAIGVISAVVLVIWASPGDTSSVSYRYSFGIPLEVLLEGLENIWNQSLIIKAIWHLVLSSLWGCFILSQISCSIKMRERQVAAGSAPVHLLIVSCLCWVLVALVVAGLVSMMVKGHGVESIRFVYLASLLIDPITWMSAALHVKPEFAIVLSAIATILHLIGASFVAMLIRENIAKVRSLGAESDQKDEG